jgi:hypothetical protein
MSKEFSPNGFTWEELKTIAEEQEVPLDLVKRLERWRLHLVKDRPDKEETPLVRKCRTCKKPLSFVHFRKNSSAADGFSGSCRKCIEFARKNDANITGRNHLLNVRLYRLRKKAGTNLFNITKEQLKELFDKADWRCSCQLSDGSYCYSYSHIVMAEKEPDRYDVSNFKLVCRRCLKSFKEGQVRIERTF